MLTLAQQHDLKPDQVERIDSWTHTRRLEHTNRPDPRTETDAKFSVQYCLARALADRKVVIDHFEGDAYKDVRIRNILPRIHAAAYTTAQFPEENHFGAEVKVTLKDGRVVSGKVDQCFGRTSEVPLPPALLKDKFINCAIAVLPEAQAADLYQAIMTFEKVGDMRELMALVAVTTRSSKRPAVAA
jgi:2-methylcitrate dehydratase PrpD